MNEELKEVIEEHKVNLDFLDQIHPDSVGYLYESLVKQLVNMKEEEE